MMPSEVQGSFSIRRAMVEDGDGILRCLGAAFEPYRQSYTAGAFADTVLTPAMVQERIATMYVFVAEDAGGTIVGTIGCSVVRADEGHIRGMAVHPAFQGTGVAWELLKAVEGELLERGCVRVSLGTTERLKQAVRFYERNGFRATGVCRDFFGMVLLEYGKVLGQ